MSSHRNYSAEYGASAGAVTVVQTKSGHEPVSRHGLRIPAQRQDWTPTRSSTTGPVLPKPGFRRNEFGGTIGGPDSQGQDLLLRRLPGHPVWRSRRQSHRPFPRSPQRNMIVSGDFSGLGTHDLRPHRPPRVDGTRTPFAGNLIPASRLDPAAVKIGVPAAQSHLVRRHP